MGDRGLSMTEGTSTQREWTTAKATGKDHKFCYEAENMLVNQVNADNAKQRVADRLVVNEVCVVLPS
jgi:hypothetical protein